jgi:hypothetical protein
MRRAFDRMSLLCKKLKKKDLIKKETEQSSRPSQKLLNSLLLRASVTFGGMMSMFVNRGNGVIKAEAGSLERTKHVKNENKPKTTTARHIEN